MQCLVIFFLLIFLYYRFVIKHEKMFLCTCVPFLQALRSSRSCILGPGVLPSAASGPPLSPMHYFKKSSSWSLFYCTSEDVCIRHVCDIQSWHSKAYAGTSATWIGLSNLLTCSILRTNYVFMYTCQDVTITCTCCESKITRLSFRLKWGACFFKLGEIHLLQMFGVGSCSPKKAC